MATFHTTIQSLWVAVILCQLACHYSYIIIMVHVCVYKERKVHRIYYAFLIILLSTSIDLYSSFLVFISSFLWFALYATHTSIVREVIIIVNKSHQCIKIYYNLICKFNVALHTSLQTSIFHVDYWIFYTVTLLTLKC